jgi:hypothetical protein
MDKKMIGNENMPAASDCTLQIDRGGLLLQIPAKIAQSKSDIDRRMYLNTELEALHRSVTEEFNLFMNSQCATYPTLYQAR